MNIRILLLLCLAAVFTGCVAPHPDPYVRHGRRGGAAAGALAGGIIGHNVRGVSKWEGAAAGAIIGGVMGDAHAKANRAYYGYGRHHHHHGHHHHHRRHSHYGHY